MFLYVRVWFSGRTRPCQGRGADSISATRSEKVVSSILVLLLLVTYTRVCEVSKMVQLLGIFNIFPCIVGAA